MLYGIDVSDAQEGIDIVTLKQQNPALGFVIVKAVGSGGYVNPDCDRVVSQCLSIDLPCAVYGFTRDMPGPPPGDPQAFADWIFSQISGYKGKVGYATDWESVVQNDPLIYQNPGYAAALQNAMAAHWGAPAGFYADFGVLTSGANWGLVEATNSWKWRASYVYGAQPFNGFGDPDWSLLAATPAWPDPPAIWQYSSSGHLAGWNGDIDFNAFNGDDAGIRRLFGIGTTAGTTQTTPSGDDVSYSQWTAEDKAALLKDVYNAVWRGGPGFDLINNDRLGHGEWPATLLGSNEKRIRDEILWPQLSQAVVSLQAAIKAGATPDVQAAYDALVQKLEGLTLAVKAS